MEPMLMRVPVVAGIIAGRGGAPDDSMDWEITGFRDIRVVTTTDQHQRLIAVPVRGDSLTCQHIYDGDYLICRITSDYEDDRIGLWQTPDGRTAKFAYYDYDGSVVLHNGGCWSQRWAPEDIRLLGLLVRVERDYE